VTTADPLHGGPIRERWRELSLAEQLANIGAEVARAARAKSAANEVRLQQHLSLALELFEFTLDDERWRDQRIEIARVRELVCDFLHGANEFRSTAARSVIQARTRTSALQRPLQAHLRSLVWSADPSTQESD
jgi:hypothetical protein